LSLFVTLPSLGHFRLFSTETTHSFGRNRNNTEAALIVRFGAETETEIQSTSASLNVYFVTSDKI